MAVVLGTGEPRRTMVFRIVYVVTLCRSEVFRGLALSFVELERHPLGFGPQDYAFQGCDSEDCVTPFILCRALPFTVVDLMAVALRTLVFRAKVVRASVLRKWPKV